MNKKNKIIVLIIVIIIAAVALIYTYRERSKVIENKKDYNQLKKAETGNNEERKPIDVDLGEIEYEEDKSIENNDNTNENKSEEQKVGSIINTVVSKLEQDKEITKKIKKDTFKEQQAVSEKGDIVVSLKGVRNLFIENSDGETLVYSPETDSYAFSKNMKFDYKKGSDLDEAGNVLVIHDTRNIKIKFYEETGEDDFITIVSAGMSVGIKGRNIYNIKVDRIGNLSVGSGDNYTATYQLENNYYKYLTIKNTGSSSFDINMKADGTTTLKGAYSNNAVLMYTEENGNSKEVSFDKTNTASIYELQILEGGRIKVYKKDNNTSDSFDECDNYIIKEINKK